MGRIRKSFASILILIMVVSSLTLMGINPLVKAQTGTNVESYVMTQDTAWTKAGSPYTLMGPVGVAKGVTLTIDAGVTVNLGSYYLEVNGTLAAIGTSGNPINFNSGSITFTSDSASWNEQAGSGCIIEHAILDSTGMTASNSVKLDYDSLSGTLQVGPSIVSNSIITGTVIASGSAQIFNNTVTDGMVGSDGGDLSSGFPTITNNTITGTLSQIFDTSGYAVITDNFISNCNTGIRANSVPVFDGQTLPIPLIQNNAIVNNDYGIAISVFDRFDVGSLSQLEIVNNTISDNTVGLSISESSFDSGPTILYNNIQDNSNYSICLSTYTSNSINATYNWWGTTNQQAINQTIYDSKDDFNIGTVNFVPFLTTPNPEAPSVTELTRTPTPISTPTPTQTSNQTITSATNPTQVPTLMRTSNSSAPTSVSQQTSAGFPTDLVAAVVAIVIVAVAIAAFMLGKSAGSSNHPPFS